MLMHTLLCVPARQLFNSQQLYIVHEYGMCTLLPLHRLCFEHGVYVDVKLYIVLYIMKLMYYDNGGL